MRFISTLAIPVLCFAGTTLLAAPPDEGGAQVFVTASNTAQNRLLVYSPGGSLLKSLPTAGKGGVSGNSGGIALADGLLAVVNFGSNSVSLFSADGSDFHLRKVIPVGAKPVSVAFGHQHLYVLGAATVESHPIFYGEVANHADGLAPLSLADGSSAQVGVLDTELIVTEKSNAIETMALDAVGAVYGNPTTVANLPANINAPFGLITRDNEAYVTIAHADEISLVRDGAVLTITPSVTQHAPCWLALAGPFLFASNSPSLTVSRYAVYGQKIVQDLAVAAQFSGDPTDMAFKHGKLAVIDGVGALSHLSIFSVDQDGNLTLDSLATINSAANGLVIVDSE